MTQPVMTQNVHVVLEDENFDEGLIRGGLEQASGAHAELKRMEAALGLVLGALTESNEGATDYVLHRLSLELRRLAEVPATAAAKLGCPLAEIDTFLLNAIAAHLYGSREEAVWKSAERSKVVLH